MYESIKKFMILLFPILLLLVVGLLLFSERMEISYTVADNVLVDLPPSAIDAKKEIKDIPSTCLLLVDSRQENSDTYQAHVAKVLDLMRVSYDLVDLAKQPIPTFSKYKTSVIAFQNLDAMQNKVLEMVSWVENAGGRVMLFCTPNGTPVFNFLSRYLGLDEGGASYAFLKGIKLKNNFMLGDQDFVFHWEEPMATALSVRLRPDVTHVYATSDDDYEMPVIWSADCGKGRFVVNNHGLGEKVTRGITCSAYSLLEDVCIYPVINASAFYLDDFPSPVPQGDGQYIRKFFNRDISSFYANVWWPDVLALADDYGIRFTGMMIEDYTDNVDPPFSSNTDDERFNYFGAMLLDHGGEIGIHGYNHQPLCFPGFDFKNEVDYNHWKTEGNAVAALQKVIDYAQTMFPEKKPTCYVPPSNILSDEGRALLKESFPQIKSIASLFLQGSIECTQEFDIGEDGIINVPRVISGTVIDDYMKWAALNTLNMYYVNTHFMHPDDTLDEDRGAALGWDTMLATLRKYIDWLYTSAPNIRNLTGSDAARAVARYDALSFERTDHENSIDLRIFGFWDEAQFMVRINRGKPGAVKGGSIEHIHGDHYLLTATSSQVSISLEG